MATRRPLVAANWKMGGSQQLAQELFEKLSRLHDGLSEVVVCPPSVYLDSVQRMLSGYGQELTQKLVSLGAQNLSHQEFGAYTGEISGAMLKEFGCSYVIIGHSERRRMYGETSDMVAEKFAMAQKMGLTPILCVGESLAAREANRTFEVLTGELDAVVDKVGIMAFDNAVLAYEPLWAIGTGKSATPEQAQEVHAFLRQRLTGLSPCVGEKLRILYGGSVKSSNAADLFNQPDVDGGLVGGASLNASEFTTLCRIASQAE
ncbi:triose-phosphate isomerase [Ferrimonas marina]|uniref:Triosephosphate isomerase n=1 Tax=Ferrimonas marina TaxID=299255 RepID=A0A1M5VB28_9GAMM|nr:triose-phosphate isomerase [Ferrimonas marina]SHH72440.1 triosephosphate isomerase [Ferrimonas marina]